MDPYGKKELVDYYDRHFRDFGDHPQSVRWTPKGQIRRFEALIEIAGNITGRDILDFGCGKGDLYGFFIEKGILVNYCGCDVNTNLIQLARQKYPEAEFILQDIEESSLNRAFDVIFICGVFNLRIAGY